MFLWNLLFLAIQVKTICLFSFHPWIIYVNDCHDENKTLTISFPPVPYFVFVMNITKLLGTLMLIMPNFTYLFIYLFILFVIKRKYLVAIFTNFSNLVPEKPPMILEKMLYYSLFRASGYFGQRIISFVIEAMKHSPFYI